MSTRVNVCSHADYIYDPEDGEVTYESADAYELAEEFDLRFGKVCRVSCLKKVADLFACEVPTAFDDEGNPEEWDLQFFASETEAHEALAKAKGGAA